MSGLEDKLINQTLLPNHALVYGRKEDQDSQTVMTPGFSNLVSWSSAQSPKCFGVLCLRDETVAQRRVPYALGYLNGE